MLELYDVTSIIDVYMVDQSGDIGMTTQQPVFTNR